MTEVWFRNPKNYALELAEVGYKNIAWDRGTLSKLNIDPVVHANMFFGDDWRALMIGAQGTMEISPERGPLNPVAVYPTWCYGDPTSMLEEMILHPVGKNADACFDVSVQVDERPVWGQKHMVVIAEGPPMGAVTTLGRKFFRYLFELQEDYPDVSIYLHNSYSYRMMFGLGFAACDVDPRTDAQKGKVILPSGQLVTYEQAQKNPKWLSAVGMSVGEIEVPRNRCIFNIKSALWAGEHYNELFPFRIARTGVGITDVVTPTIEYKPDGTKHYATKVKRKKEGDYIACDTCSLAKQCKYEREGAVCSVPNSEGEGLAKYFRTRDSQTIMDGLSEVLAIGAKRIEEGVAEEEVTGINPEVTKMLNGVFAQGVQLAKLVDPALRSPKVAVNVQTGGGDAQISMGSSKPLISKIIRELEMQGIRREDITPTMVEGVLAGMVNPASANRAIEGTVISQEDRSA